MTEKRREQTTAPPVSFEESLARLEAIVFDLEEGQISLADSLARYEEGVKLLRKCYHLLEHAERRIELLNRVDPAGNAESEPFDDGATSLEEKAHSRGRRRSRGADSPPLSSEDEIDGPGRLF